MPSLFAYMSSTIKNRRDFLKILIGGTGASYMMLNAGCNNEKVHDNLKPLSGRNPQSTLKRQRFALAHEYIRGNAFNPSQKVSKIITSDVLIIGAGATGLTAALQLQDKGIKAVIVENESQPGGAGIKGKKGDIYYPYGSVYFVTYDDTIKAFCERIGVSPIHAPEDAVLYKGELIENIWSDKSLSSLSVSLNEKDSLKKFRDFLLDDDNIPSYPLPKQLNPTLASLDSRTGRQFLSSYKSPFLDSLLNLYSKSSMGATLDETNAYCLLNFYASELGAEYDKYRYTFPGGMNELYSGISKSLQSDTQFYNHLIFSVKNTPQGISALCITDTLEIIEFRAKYAIVSSQKHIASRIVEGLPDSQISAMNSLQYPPYCTIHMHSAKNLFPNHIMDVWTIEADAFCTDIICSNSMRRDKDPTDTFVYSIFGAMSQDKRSVLLDDTAMAAHAYSIVKTTSDYLDNNMIDSIIEIETFAWGHALSIPFPGSHNGIAQMASTPFNNILFAASDNDAASSFENAFYYGIHAADTIAQTMKS